MEVGGGIRTEEAIDRYLSLGAGRVILGTVAVTDYPFMERMVRKYGDRIAVGVDTRDGYVATDGWLKTSRLEGVEFCRRLRESGVKTVIYTDISRDGKMQGTNLAIYERLGALGGLQIVASGGISRLEEIEKLRSLVYGAILGKALYLGAIDLREALRAGRRPRRREMITKRIIPCLDVKDGRVVKGVNFEGIQDVADPVEMAEFYNASGRDELVFYDITASAEGRRIFTDILTRTARRVFIPLTVGGGNRLAGGF